MCVKLLLMSHSQIGDPHPGRSGNHCSQCAGNRQSDGDTSTLAFFAGDCLGAYRRKPSLLEPGFRCFEVSSNACCEHARVCWPLRGISCNASFCQFDQ